MMTPERTTDEIVEVEPKETIGEEREVAAEEHGELFTSEEGDRLRSRWESIQSSFVDEPRESVAEADRLVSDLVDRITERFTEQREELESAWERGEEISTETLRITLQRYRTFFERLLAL